MCPEFEIEEREYQKSLHELETVSSFLLNVFSRFQIPIELIIVKRLKPIIDRLREMNNLYPVMLGPPKY